MKSWHTFLVDTKSTCFLCLKTDISPHSNENDEKRVHSMMNVSRYLKLDFTNFISHLNLQQNSDQEMDLTVVVCKQCCSVLTKFDTLFHELEIVRLKLNANVETIYKLLIGGKSDADRMEEFRQLGTENNLGDVITEEVVELIWNKLLQKCSHRVLTSFPKVELERLKTEDKGWLTYSMNGEASVELMISENSEKVSSNWSENDNESPEEGDYIPLVAGDNISCEEDEMNQDPLDIENETNGSPKKDNTKSWKPRCKNGSRVVYPKCKVCGKTLSIRGLEIHMRTHTGEMPFKCTHCSQRFRSKCNLKKHTLSKHRSVVFEDCRKDENGKYILDEQFEAGVNLLFENPSRSSSGGYVCKYCSKEYRVCHRNDLEGHMIRVHFEKLKEQLKHNLCGKVVSVRKEIPIHRRKCHVCGKVVYRKHYKTHLMTHTGEKPMQCPHCPERFKIGGYLRWHTMMKHRDIVFKDCRDTKTTDDQFKNGITRLFEKYNGQPFTKGDSYYCNFCNRKPFGSRFKAEYHMIEVHYKLLCSQLKEILRGGSPDIKTTLVQDQDKRKQTKYKKDKWKDKVRRVKFNCAHCDNQFDTQYKHRLHLVNYHRFKLFRKYFPVGATTEQVHSVIKQVPQKECRQADVKRSDFQCNFPNCKLKFIRVAHLEFHVLVAHFTEVVPKLKNYFQGGTCSLQSIEGEGAQTDELELEDDLIKREIVKKEEEVE